ncbi:MAG: bifunctional DNA-formamidopyrimidine glycosylase/DNA-(apurinic or apyrimidinic site) lyase [Candidatus Dormibacteraeota bacterium]|uniref:Formamidopyrimidine-DNA glycosylase n=1 Tax=Candidatus Amunia macphersoniae TaxID=3127014 RepID=A0A934KFK0_9BACT|nr:bifunctional DNA-formamidopyrimidine glycosylase/DNA-(apurinic or apyrimidinic site) lyase [Candidatus Dormibacteraeota bacterium]
MPELPEVETVARDLRGAVVGRQVMSLQLGHPKVLRFPVPEVFAAVLPGQRVEAVNRRGKFIFCALDSGEDLVFHLGMTGHLLVCASQTPPAPHTHLRALLDDGRELRYDDARRFGRILLGPRSTLEDSRVLPALGVEPLSEDFTPGSLDTWLRSTTRSLKAALLDQRGVAGLGNIYVDEACHLAGVRPTRRCNTLTRAQRAALHAAIPAVLRTAIGNRGSSIDDYRDLWNAKGSNQERLQVYGRGGRPCMRCGVLLRQTTSAGRTTVYCPACQR